MATIDGPLANDVVSYTYDELGRPLSRNIAGQTTSVLYDVLDRVTTQTCSSSFRTCKRGCRPVENTVNAGTELPRGTMRIGRLDVERWRDDRLWLGTDPLYATGVVLVSLSHIADDRIYEEARLVSQIPAEAHFRPIDIIMDAQQAKAGYAMLIPAKVKSLKDGTSTENVLTIARELARTVLVLHRAGLAYRNFGSSAFLASGEHVVPCDFSRATRLEEGPDYLLVGSPVFDQGIAAPLRQVMPFDPPEVSRESYDGVRADIYGLGMLMAELDPDRSRFGRLIDWMTAREPMSRPNSVAIVVAELERA